MIAFPIPILASLDYQEPNQIDMERNGDYLQIRERKEIVIKWNQPLVRPLEGGSSLSTISSLIK